MRVPFMYYTYFQSPFCKLLIAGEDGILKQIDFLSSENSVPIPPPDWHLDDSPLKDAIHQLEAYFSGELKQFSLEIALEGTPFQCLVWSALQKTAYGSTISYGELARLIGNPKACRAVGTANARNPLPIIVPCHRVIGSNGKLVGFGGGLELKQALLDHERRHC
ncbi:methylated-DNA--[protein]-cysteine S-methyltransferase [Desulfococcaceae bacterium HSG9]|nr:methylated-DNA--[protein]-cysteine S-methyltransferase [Desulfococcaceae bacterium HSG9]